MCAILGLFDNKGMMFGSSLWVSCTRLPSGKSNRGPCVVLHLFSQGVSTLV